MTNEDIFDQLYVKHERMVKGQVAKQVGLIDRDDICQDVWVIAWSKIEEWGQMQNSAAWLSKVTHDKIIDYKRRKQANPVIGVSSMNEKLRKENQARLRNEGLV